MMRKSDIKTIKKAQQTVYFFNTLQHTPSAIFIQLTSNTQEQFLKLAAAVKKLDFFILTSLVKDHDTPNLFKCVTMIASNKSKTWTEVETCIKTVKLFIQLLYFS
uniref:Uncharacterized protein n=1 Tax=Tsukubamonas globosa TaxID=875863 RepID=W8VKH1_9EUKA|nr:hypothetical protein [Tsukubamonas globosa]BAO51946.1 hypothetical protein [Tsukubamonas globosa]